MKLINLVNFNHFEYQFFSKLKNGYINWIIPEKLLACSTPVNPSLQIKNKEMLNPAQYSQIFNNWKINTVVRLCKPKYSRKAFVKAGIQHFDLYFKDGGLPDLKIIKNFFKIISKDEVKVAVHCKAGLGRTGTLIALYLMCFYGFGAKEAIAYVRLMRPGSIIGI